MSGATPVRECLNQFMAEAVRLRFGEALPVTDASPQQVLAALQDVRARLDRVEEIYGKALRLRSAYQRAATLATATVDDAWDRAAQRLRTAPVARGDEFSSARERHAEANLAVLDERKLARDASDLAHSCDLAVELLRLTHRGLDGVRQDLLAILRALQFESHLERS